MGGLALEANDLRAVDGHGVPFCNIIDSRTLLAGPVGTGLLKRVGVKGCGAVGDWFHYFHVRAGMAQEKNPPNRGRTSVEMHFA